MNLRFTSLFLVFFQSLLSQEISTPTVVESWINAGSPQRSMIQSVGVRFERNVSGLVKKESLKIRSLTTGDEIDLSNTTLVYDPRNNSANWMINRDTGALLQDGNYLGWIETDTLVSEPERAACAVSATPLDDFVFEFHQMTGDTDGDRDVDFLDSCVLRETWQQDINQDRYRSFLDFDLNSLVDEGDRGRFVTTYFSVFPAEPGIHLYLRNDTGDDASDNATSLYGLGIDSTALNEAASWTLSLGGNDRDITSLVSDGAAVIETSVLDDLNGGALAIGDYQVTVAARDAGGVLLTSEVLDFSYLGDVPCGPYFTSTPVRGVSLGSVSGSQPVGLASWTVEQWPTGGGVAAGQGPANWVIAADGLSAEQTINAAPSALMSSESLLNVKITGGFRVDTGFDDDFIGFIFGFQDLQNFYLFDWKQNAQSSAGKGMTIKRVKIADLDRANLWSSSETNGDVTILSPPNEIGWEDFQDYDITLDLIPGKIAVEVREEGVLLDRLEVEDENFTGGKFGFYNFSQDSVIYRGFTQEALNNNYFYDADAFDPDGGTITYSFGENEDGSPIPDGATIDPRTGALLWEPSEAGAFPFTILATDNDGLTDAQEFEVLVTPVDEPPVVNIVKTAPSIFPGDPISFQVQASDDQQLFRVRLFIDDLEVSIDEGGNYTTTFSEIGSVELRAVAIDSAEQVASVTSFVRVLDPDAPTTDGQNSTPINPPGQSSGVPTNLQPVVAIEAPLTTGDDPSAFIGTVGAKGGVLASWAFEWTTAAQVDFDNLVSPSVLWQELASGTDEFSSTQFATITPADFPDELIAFRLRAENTNGLGAISSIVFNPRSASTTGPTVETGAGGGPAALASFTAPLTVSDDRTLIRGSIDANGGTLQSWILDVAPRNQVDPENLSDPTVAWTILAQGTTPVTNELLTTLDPASFTNQVYLFRLSARNDDGAGTIASLVFNPIADGFQGPESSTGEVPATAQRPVCRITSPQSPSDDRTMLLGSVLANGGTLQNWIVDYAPRTQVNPNDLTDPSVTWTSLAEGTDEKMQELLTPLTAADFNAGTWIVRLRAFNTNGLGCLSSIQLDTGDTSIPAVAILTPAAEEDITYISDVTGTVDAGGGVLDSWKLELASTTEVSLANLNTSANWTLLGSGTTAITEDVLGMIDPTSLQNGSYVLRLSARNTNGRGIADGIIIYVCGEAKLGNFRLEFEDLNIPLAGIPIRINRIYDTLNANRSGDFGYGWTLGIGDPDLRETVPDNGDSYFFPNPFEIGTRVFLTTPDGRRVGFTFNVRNPRNRFLFIDYEPYFEPDPGVYETLTIAPGDFQRVEVDAEGAVYTPLIPFGFNPENYRLTTREGLTYHINQRSGLQRISDRNGQQVSFSRNAITHSSGQELTLERDSRGRVTTINIQGQNPLRYRYDSNGDLTEFVDEAGNSTRFSYVSNPAHYLETIANPADAMAGLFTRRVIYESGRVARVVDRDGNPVSSQSYDPDSFTGTQTDAEGNVTVLTYDDLGNILSAVSPEGLTTSYEFSDPANPNLETARVEPDGGRFTYRYDASGNGLEEMRPDGTRTENDYANNLLTAVRVYDSEGNTMTSETLTYDESGNVTTIERQDGTTSTLDYNDEGLPTRFADFDGSDMVVTYNDRNTIPATITYSDGREIQITTNNRNLVTEIGYAGGYTEFREYDGAGRMTRRGVEGGQIITMEYDLNGYVLRTIDSLGRITEFQRDAAGRLLSQRFSHSTEDGPAAIVSYERDGEGRLLALTDPEGNRTAYTYNGDGKFLTRTDALGRTTTLTYDDGGRVGSITDRRGLKRSFGYHESGQVEQEIWHNLEGDPVRQIDFDYDVFSRLIQMRSPDSTYTFGWDSRDRLISEDNAGTLGAPNVILQYSYAAGSELATRVSDNLGTSRDYRYGEGRVLSEISWTVEDETVAYLDFERSQRNLLTGLTRRNGDDSSPVVSRTEHSRNTFLGTLETITHLGPDGELIAPEADIRYEYNQEGLVTRVTRGENQTDYGYDRFGQLISARDGLSSDLLESYEYDLAGNRTNSHLQGDTEIGVGNRLLSDALFDYVYDNEGNLTSKTNKLSGELTSFEWDHLNRNTRISVADGDGNLVTTIEKTFDVKHRIIVTAVDGEISHTVWEGVRPWADFDNDGEATQRYLFGERTDEIHAYWKPESGVSWTLVDLVGSVNFELDAAGELTNSFRFDSFGNILSGTFNDLGFTGRPMPLSGLQDLRMRLFDSVSGRFLGEDPLGFAASDWNLYRYGSNSPLSGSDPLGTEFTVLGQTTVAGLVGVLAKGVFTAGTIALKSAAIAAAAGAAGTLVVELFDFALSKFPCSGPRQLRLEKLIKTVREGAVQNVKDSAAGGLIGIAAAPLAAIWGFYTGPLYSAMKKAGTRSLECLDALKNSLGEMFTDLKNAGMELTPDIQPDFR